MKTILFDIDGTLVKSSKMSSENFWRDLLREVYGCGGEFGIEKVVSHGKTHKQIVFEALMKEGISRKEIEEKWTIFKKSLVERYASSIESVEPFEDAKETLENLKKKGFRLGLITGNIRGVAMVKLKFAGLDSYFSFGGFGDNFNRDDVAKEAVDCIKDGEIFLVGDTPLDIIAGKRSGTKTIGITTGVYSEKELKDAGTNVVVSNLKQLGEYFDE